MFYIQLLILDAHATQEVAGGDVDSVGIIFWTLHRLVTGAADETVAFNNHIDVGGNEQFHSTQEGVDVYLLVLADHGLSQVHPQATAESVQSCATELLAPEDITIGTKIGRTMDALAILAQRQGTLQPL